MPSYAPPRRRPNRAITQPAHLRNHTSKKSPPHPDSPPETFAPPPHPTPHHAPPPWSLLRATPKSPEPATEPSGTGQHGTAPPNGPAPRNQGPISRRSAMFPERRNTSRSSPLRATAPQVQHRRESEPHARLAAQTPRSEVAAHTFRVARRGLATRSLKHCFAPANRGRHLQCLLGRTPTETPDRFATDAPINHHHLRAAHASEQRTGCIPALTRHASTTQPPQYYATAQQGRRAPHRNQNTPPLTPSPHPNPQPNAFHRSPPNPSASAPPRRGVPQQTPTPHPTSTTRDQQPERGDETSSSGHGTNPSTRQQ